jgi:TldD protein
MKELAARALDTAQSRGARYADARLVEARQQSIAVKNGRVAALSDASSRGLGIRVLVGGAWGFAATGDLTPAAIDAAAARAVAIGQASRRARQSPVVLAPVAAARASYETPHRVDPFAVALSDKVDLLLRAEAALRAGGDARLKVGQASMQFWDDRKLFLSTEGADITQRILHSGAGIAATAVGEDDVQVRSYPCSFGGQFEANGYELVERLDLARHAPRVADEALALLTADACPAGRRTIVLDGSQVSLQIHESCGHPSELDRALGSEANFAGTSFLTPDQRGRLQYGSKLVTIVADATCPQGLGTFGFDDEGVPAQCADLVREGRFVGYLTSRETAASLGQDSNGTMRADSWAYLPLIRMTNINLLPGTAGTLDDLVADTDDGILMAVNRSWSIDDRRFNFQFGTEIGWEVKRGKKVRMLKNCTYTGITPQFWNSCDAICDERDWLIWGTPNCGKGQPAQTMRTAQGAAAARFRDVEIGVGRRGDA